MPPEIEQFKEDITRAEEREKQSGKDEIARMSKHLGGLIIRKTEVPGTNVPTIQSRQPIIPPKF